MNLRDIKHIHFVGIGGINMSAVAKLLLSSGVVVSGSDLVASEQTEILQARGAKIVTGFHASENVPADTELIVITSATRFENPEREEGRKREIRELTNFEFLGEWFADAKSVLVTGTHGKSTTTAMLGTILVKAGMDPTVIVGSKVPSFEEGNLYIGKSNLFLIEGDEASKHFLAFHPKFLVINNIELDHTDVYPTIEAMLETYRQLLSQMPDGATIVANVGDERVAKLVDEVSSRPLRIVRFCSAEELSSVVSRLSSADIWRVSRESRDGFTDVRIEKTGVAYTVSLSVIGAFNAMNAAGAALMARELGVAYPMIAGSLESFTGIWRRMELLQDKEGIRIYSDYGHHPTAVMATMRAAKEAFPDRRVLLCFQPHHRNRTKHLFTEFVSAFDDADVLVLCEIYDVKGRDEPEDADVSSRMLLEALSARDAVRGVDRAAEYAPNPQAAVERVVALAQPGDVIVIMGAGDIDGCARDMLHIKL